MDEQALNKKVAEWAGFRQELAPDSFRHIYGDIWRFPNSWWAHEPPNFTQSLDACFKWLVPNLQRVEITQELKQQSYARIVVQPNLKYEDYQEWDDTPALALCLAIEKLIDGEKE